MERMTSFASPVSGHLNVDGFLLHYLKYGDGAQLVIAFHGYGGNAALFGFLNNPDFTVISLELPYHGASGTGDGLTLSAKGLADAISGLMRAHEVREAGLIAFSLGARACLCIAGQIPDQVRNIVLIAPDGIRANFLYHFLTGTLIGRRLFRSFAAYGHRYIRVLSVLHRLRIISRYKYRFALQYIRTPESRMLLWHIWMSTRHLLPDVALLKKQISKRHTPVHILMGQHDNIIPLNNAFRFKGSNPYIQVHVFERGHNLLEYEEVKGMAAAWLFRVNTSRK